MSDNLFIILVLIMAFGIVFGVAAMLNKRSKTLHKIESKPPSGPISKILLWISYGLLIIAVLFIIGTFAFNQEIYAGFAGSLVFLYIIVGVIYRIMKAREQ